MRKILLSTIALSTVIFADANVASTVAPIQSEKSLFDRVHAKGDLRLRYESIERDDKGDTYRNRYRLRLGLNIDVTDNLTFESGMRSGFANPTSGNQTFKTDEALSDYFWQSLRFNILGVAYKSANAKYKVGRQPYMMYRPIKSQLVWDNDISMNGVNYQYKDDTKLVTLGLNQPTLEEASEAKDDVNLVIAQYVHKTKVDAGKLNLGAGAYYYDGFKGNTTFFGSRKGNSLDANNLYANDYHLAEGFAELELKNVLGKPLKIAGGVVYNFGADNNNFGYDVAAQLGKAKSVGDWQVKYSYTDLEEDAVLGAYSDSDNFGGGTASKGHAIRAKYKAGKNLFLAGNFFFNELYASKSSTNVEADYERVQLDMIYKF
ncbi:MAG: Outer membrane receptor for ferric coprogen and ferric-rhodotorulic acid [uncultured Sulfurovum sp.]|uniref:Outer membrane receptor for ferric coprogen and ferric-rhodotorulic acid n=1 Tax=uncultured Sulfurovum sp. TaxID=269237 RepID=A0A6S6TJH6_9BACT|nr:MAG: Outer membrane receptor for ferric coprogen and ferric-rhodotorulic acid [uncultured Sulfurovum sp.]